MRLFTVATFVVLILGCAAGKKDESTTTTGTSSSSSSSSNLGQDPACADYLNCLAAVDPATLVTLQSSYGAEGSCWLDEVSAEQCATACETGLEQMLEAFPDEQACGAPPPGAEQVDGPWEFIQRSTDDDCTKAAEKVTVDGVFLSFKHSDATHTHAAGFDSITFNRDSSDVDVSVDCTYSAGDVACKTVSTRIGVNMDLTFSGHYADEKFTGTLEVVEGDGASGTACTTTAQLEGSRLQ